MTTLRRRPSSLRARDASAHKGKGRGNGRPLHLNYILWVVPWVVTILFIYHWSYFGPTYYDDTNPQHPMALVYDATYSTAKTSAVKTSAKSTGSLRTTSRKTSDATLLEVPCNSSTSNRDPNTALILSEPPEPRTPTHKSCNGYDGIYHINSGDVGGAAGTIFFQFVIAQLIYCEMYNLKPWIHLDLTSLHVVDYNVHFYNRKENAVPHTEFTMMKGMTIPYLEDYRLPEARYPGPPQLMSPPMRPHTFGVKGDGVWEHYFEPVSDFVPGDESCEVKPFLTMDIWLITPGLHIYAPWTPRIWRYSILPDYFLKRHLTHRQWLEPQRLAANRVTQKYIQPRHELWAAANKVNPSPKGGNSTNDCVGLHVRWTDKEGGRRLIDVDEFLPYVEAYVNNGGSCVFVATDSGKALKHMSEHWPENIRPMIRSQGDFIIRSDDDVPVFQKGASSHHRTNIEVLVDILALAKCRFMLHGLSAVTDSAMYLNYDLIYQSVDLEDKHRFSPDEFGDMVHDVLSGAGVNHSRFFPKEWWEQDYNVTGHVAEPTDHACENFKGILHIEYAGAEATAGMAFFHYILNQLIYAEMHNLKPWVHLSDRTPGVYDELTHAVGPGVSFEMMEGTEASIVRDPQRPESLYPGPLVKESTAQKKTYKFKGTGVWEHYIEPVSDFVPGDKSCRKKPLVRLGHRLVEPGLRSFAPWSVKSKEFEDTPRHMGKPIHGNYSAWYEPMRAKAHEVVKKYFNFRPFILERVREVMTVDTTVTPCLAVHMAKERDIYVEYMEAFVRAGGECIYLATETWDVIDWLESKPQSITDVMIWQGEHVVRTIRELPVQEIEDRHHRINSETFVDVLAMAECNFLLHEFKTVAEAVMYFNPDLIKRSVSVEDNDKMKVEEFEKMVRTYLANHKKRSKNKVVLPRDKSREEKKVFR